MDAATIDCIQCGKPFKRRHANKKLCSKACRRKRNARSKYRRRYGITLREAEELLASQGGSCAICCTKLKFLSKKYRTITTAFVDHCHKTGAVRGILCPACNNMLGGSKDDPELLIRAIEYLK